MIAVADTGAGMDEATLARAFDPFFTTKEAGKGTGLGLSQVYGFVRQTGGHVRIYSEVGEGTTVKIYLRRHVGDEKDAAQGTREPAAGAIGSETILVVEDDAALRSYTIDILNELGYRVLEAQDGRSALQVLGTQPRRPVVHRCRDAGRDERPELADQALRDRPDLRVLFTTG
jgi:hypothetical protein